MTTEFDSFNLRPELVQAVAALGYVDPTPIQTGIIPLMMSGLDVIGQAQTGTGKTAAFALPILHNLQPSRRAPQALIMAPTRELALQVAEAFSAFGQFGNVQCIAIYGGSSYGQQIWQLKRGVDVVVGTPGRLLDLLNRGLLDLSSIRTLVLDEADEMLSMGFIEDIEAILAATPTERQTALFSATLPTPIRHLAAQYMRQPQSVTIQREQVTVAELEQRCYLVHQADKTAALTRLFEMEEITSALIFVRTRAASGELANELATRGFPAEALNGDLSQEAREHTLNRFRQGNIKVLVATDVAARGLDIEGITHVFNYDLPHDAEGYVHRVGRTGRAGRTGIAITLATPFERRRLREIEYFTRQKMTMAKLPTAEEILARREAQLVNQLNVWLQRGRCRQERAIVETLVAQGNDVLEVAAAALKIARSEEKQRPIAHVQEVVEEAPRRYAGRRFDERGDGYREGRGEDHGAGRRSPNPRYTGREFGEGHDAHAPHAPRAGSPRMRPPYRGEGRAPDFNISHEPGMVRLTLNMGKSHGIRPADVVGAIAYHADIPGSTIGKIQIAEKHTLVDVPEQLVGQVLAKTGKYIIRKQSFTIERA